MRHGDDWRRWLEENNLEDEELGLAKAGKEIVKVESFLPKLPLDEALVESFVRRVEARGSDVRLDLGLLFLPDAWPRSEVDCGRWKFRVIKAFPWRRAEHINVLELRATLLTLMWRARNSGFHSCRFVHLKDSQVGLGVLVKGRSSSFMLKSILKRICGLVLTPDIYGVFGYVGTANNPADAASRIFDG